MKHGTHTAYTYHSCRCPECREAHRLVVTDDRQKRIRRLAEDPTIAPHGRASTYLTYGCRCPECRTAHTQYLKQRYLARKRRKLTRTDVAAARHAVAAGTRVADVARDLGIHRDTVARAVYGLTWAKLSKPPPLPRQRVPARARRVGKLTAEQVAEARRQYAAGTTKRALAVACGVGEDTIREAIHGVTWQDVTDPPPVPR